MPMRNHADESCCGYYNCATGKKDGGCCPAGQICIKDRSNMTWRCGI
jgi:hypothetical protein